MCAVQEELFAVILCLSLRGSFSVFFLFLFNPQCLLMHYRDLTSFAMIADDRASRGSLPSCPNLSDREKSNNLPSVLLIPGMLVTRRWPHPCSALACADSNPPVLKHCGPRYILGTLTSAPGALKVGCAISCFFFFLWNQTP